MFIFLLIEKKTKTANVSFIWVRDIKGSPPQETFQCGELRPERKLQGALQGLAEKSLQLLKWQNLL